MLSIAPAIAATLATDLPAVLYVHGFSLRKQAILRRFVPHARLRFIRRGASVPATGCLLLWGSAPAPADLAPDVQIVRVEDGFLRSVGLGADLVRPVSWVLDRRGIYYDATRPSDLEWLLQTATFKPALLARAAQLRERIREAHLTKYNVGAGSWTRPATATHVILVPGQVESDAAIRLATPGIHTNIALLQAVRVACPNAYIVYKPHPDVVAKLRACGQGEQDAHRWCDELVGDVPMSKLLEQVDAVHVLTSLTGFEALLRDMDVTCHGQPFYAGWGLTTDLAPIPRRCRRLALDELVAATLILYPRYVAHDSGRPTTPELALEGLLAWRVGTASAPRRQLWRTILRVMLSIQGRTR